MGHNIAETETFLAFLTFCSTLLLWLTSLRSLFFWHKHDLNLIFIKGGKKAEKLPKLLVSILDMSGSRGVTSELHIPGFNVGIKCFEVHLWGGNNSCCTIAFSLLASTVIGCILCHMHCRSQWLKNGFAVCSCF